MASMIQEEHFSRGGERSVHCVVGMRCDGLTSMKVPSPDGLAVFSAGDRLTPDVNCHTYLQHTRKPTTRQPEVRSLRPPIHE